MFFFNDTATTEVYSYLHTLTIHGALPSVGDAGQVVGNGREIAGLQLRMKGARIEQGGGGTHEVEGREHFVEFDGARFAVDFVKCKAHGHAHEEHLRQFDATAAQVQEVAEIGRAHV